MDTISHDLDVSVVADYFITADASRSEPDVTPLKLQKLLYLAQANYLAATDCRLFAAPVEAFENGPVVYDVYKKFEGSRQIICVSPTYQPEQAFDVPKDAEAFLNKIWDKYKDWTASRLWRLTHDQEPWQQHYDGSYRTVIPDDALKSYFRRGVNAAERVFHEDLVLLPTGFMEQLENRSEEIGESLRALRSRRSIRTAIN